MTQETTEYMTVPDKGFFFVPLGGVGEIGMNFSLYACDGEWIAVDCGIGFAGDGLPGIDKLLPDPVFARKISSQLKALIITHAHEDHIGAVASFWRDLRCPVYVSPFSKEMLEDRLDEASLLGRVPIEVFYPNDVLEFDNMTVSFLSLNHSVPEAANLLIETSYGNVFHTGDWRFDKKPVLGKATDEKDLKRIKSSKLLALIGDSTNVFVEKEDACEEDVADSLKLLFARYADKRIVVTCFASNVARLESIAVAAKANGREICLTGRSLWRVEGAARASGYFKNIPVFLTPEEAKEMPLNKVVYVLTGCQGEPKAALSNLSYGVLNALRLEKGDVVIFSSRTIPGNEQAIANLQNRFIAKEIQLITAQTELVHVSGHATRHDMQRMYQFIKPKLVIPVHGEIAHLREHENLAKQAGVKETLFIKDGDVVRLAPEKPAVLGCVETGVLAMDAKQIIPVNADVIRKRRKMITEGTVVVSLVMDKKQSLLADPQISAVGLIDAQSQEMIFLKQVVKQALENQEKGFLKTDENVFQTVKSVVRQYVMQTYGRKPMVETHLIRV